MNTLRWDDHNFSHSAVRSKQLLYVRLCGTWPQVRNKELVICVERHTGGSNAACSCQLIPWWQWDHSTVRPDRFIVPGLTPGESVPYRVAADL